MVGKTCLKLRTKYTFHLKHVESRQRAQVQGVVIKVIRYRGCGTTEYWVRLSRIPKKFEGDLWIDRDAENRPVIQIFKQKGMFYKGLYAGDVDFYVTVE